MCEIFDQSPPAVTGCPVVPRHNDLGMRVWTETELQLIRVVGETTEPFSVSAAFTELDTGRSQPGQ